MALLARRKPERYFKQPMKSAMSGCVRRGKRQRRCSGHCQTMRSGSLPAAALTRKIGLQHSGVLQAQTIYRKNTEAVHRRLESLRR
jgi:hypothetical protein